MIRLMIVSLLLLPLHLSAEDLPDMGTSANTILNAAQEKEIGESYLQHLRQHNETLDDLAVDNYLNRLGYQLVSHTQSASYPFTFFALKDTNINAFAVPGGFIGVNAGLILHSKNESELAAVMAHEVSHVTLRHINRSIEKMKGYSAPMIAAMFAAMALASQNAELGQAAIASMIAGSIQMQIDFTRTHEKEADRVGMEVLSKAGFDPNSMYGFFQTLQNNSRYMGAVPEFLRSHPLTTNRIAEAKSLASRYPKAMVKDSVQYHLMRAKVLIATTENMGKRIKQLQQSLKSRKFRDERAVRYGLLLALLKNGESKGVKTQLDWLQQNDGDRVIYHLADARLQLLKKQPESAKAVYKNALDIYPSDKMLSLAYGQLLIQEKEMETALSILLPLKNSLQSHQIPDYYLTLAQAYKGLHKRGESHLALAEHHIAKGKNELAINQLEQGLALPRLDFYLKSKLQAALQIQNDLLAEEEKDKQKLRGEPEDCRSDARC